MRKKLRFCVRIIKMSKFFQGSDSDSETSSSEEEIYSEQEQEDESEHDLGMSDGDEDEDDSDEGSSEDGDPADRRKMFLKDAAPSDESDAEDSRRIVKSAKDKRMDEIEATSKAIENAGKINDWVTISNGAAFCNSANAKNSTS
jgi:translation initiation factor 3 subunit C